MLTLLVVVRLRWSRGRELDRSGRKVRPFGAWCGGRNRRVSLMRLKAVEGRSSSSRLYAGGCTSAERRVGPRVLPLLLPPPGAARVLQ